MQFASIPADLTRFIAGIVERRETQAGRAVIELPLARLELVFNFGDPFEMALAGAPSPTPAAMTLGPRVGAFEAREGARVHFFVVQLTAAGVRALTGSPPRVFMGRALCLADVLDDGPALSDALAGAGGFAARAAIVFERMRRAAAAPGREDAAVLRIADAITEGSLRGPVDAIAARAGLGVRALRSRFQAEIGLSPKTLLRLSRFERMLHSIHAGLGASWLRFDREDAALEYYDQAHLIRDFREFAGITPGAYTRVKQAGSRAIYTVPAAAL